MSEVPPEQLAAIAQLCDGEPTYREDGWRKLIFMPGLKFLVGGAQRTMDALLCLNHNNPTYPTKLYLAECVGGGVNWNEDAHILARHWFTFSWAGISPTLPPIEILALHLAPLNKGKAA